MRHGPRYGPPWRHQSLCRRLDQSIAYHELGFIAPRPAVLAPSYCGGDVPGARWWLAPGADVTDLRCRPGGWRLEYPESARHAHTYIDAYLLYLLVDCEPRFLLYLLRNRVGAVG
jgi:hypothetical protein